MSRSVAPAGAAPQVLEQPGRLWAWGANHLGQMGAGPGWDQLKPQPVPGLPLVRAVCTNASAVLALDADHRIWSWGWNTRGMLGRGRPADEKAYWLPTVLRDLGHRNLDPAGNPPEQPSSEGLPDKAPAQAPDEDVDVGWEAELQDFLSSTPVHVSPATVMEGVCTPSPLQGLPPARQIAISNENGFALDEGGAVWAWGAGGHMGIPLPKGQALPQPALTPVRVAGLPPVVAIAAHPAADTAYALDSQGTVWSWGHGHEGELGQGKRRADPVPAPIAGLPPVRSIHALDFAALAVLADGRVFGWGSAERGVGFEAARKSTWRVTEPVPVAGLAGPVQSLWAGHGLVVYRLDDGSTWVCGSGVRGMYPASPQEPPRVPLRQPDLDNFAAFFLGDHHGFAVDAAGVLHGYGHVEAGALGQGECSADVQRDWVLVSLPHAVVAMAAAGHHSLAICAAG